MRLVSQVPLAKATGGVAVLPQHLGEGDLIGVQPAVVAGKSDHQVSAPAVHANAVGVGSGEQGGPRWGACGIGDIKLSELDSLLCHSIEVRRLVDPVAKGPDIPISHIIDEEDDDVRSAYLGFCACVANRNKDQQQRTQE